MKPLDALPERLEPLVRTFFPDDAKVVVDLVVSVAYADGKVDRDERAGLRVTLETLFSSYLTAAAFAIVVREAIEGIDAKGPVAYAEDVGRRLASHGAVDGGLEVALTIAETSEGISKEERLVLDGIARGAGASDRLAAVASRIGVAL